MKVPTSCGVVAYPHRGVLGPNRSTGPVDQSPDPQRQGDDGQSGEEEQPLDDDPEPERDAQEFEG